MEVQMEVRARKQGGVCLSECTFVCVHAEYRTAGSLAGARSISICLPHTHTKTCSTPALTLFSISICPNTRKKQFRVELLCKTRFCAASFLGFLPPVKFSVLKDVVL